MSHFETVYAGENPPSKERPLGGGARYVQVQVDGPEPDRTTCRDCDLCRKRRENS